MSSWSWGSYGPACTLRGLPVAPHLTTALPPSSPPWFRPQESSLQFNFHESHSLVVSYAMIDDDDDWLDFNVMAMQYRHSREEIWAHW